MTQTYIALFKGINVGGHHKVPMASLRKEMEALALTHVVTLLNSGNVFFDSIEADATQLEDKISKHLEGVFGFAIPVWVIKGEAIQSIIEKEPFQKVDITKDTRLYVSFLKAQPQEALDLPWKSEDGSYTILGVQDNMICSELDLSIGKTVKGMEVLEKLFGNVTTRNWNTILRIGSKLKSK